MSLSDHSSKGLLRKRSLLLVLLPSHFQQNRNWRSDNYDDTRRFYTLDPPTIWERGAASIALPWTVN